MSRPLPTVALPVVVRAQAVGIDSVDSEKHNKPAPPANLKREPELSFHGKGGAVFYAALAQHHFSVERHMTPVQIQNTFLARPAGRYRAFEHVHFMSAIYEGGT